MTHTPSNTARREALGLLARSPVPILAACMSALGPLPEFSWLRKPETGLVMLRGRIGGTGAQFNLGEATVTRCALRTNNSLVGVGTVRGRNARHAEYVALCDAMLQHPDLSERVRSHVLDVLEKTEFERHQQRSAEIAASKVDFFTLVRGEDQ